MMKRLHWVIGLSIVVLVGAGLLTTAYLLRSKESVLSTAKQQASYVIYYPADNGKITVLRESVVYSESEGLFSYQAKDQAGTVLTFSMQASPSEFTEVPEVYGKYIQKLREVATFDSVHGVVYIAEPQDFAGEQVAVMNAKGTLLFVRSPEKKIETDWRRLFNGLKVL